MRDYLVQFSYFTDEETETYTNDPAFPGVEIPAPSPPFSVLPYRN